MSKDLLKEQQKMFKEHIDELYFIQKKVEERVREFTAKQIELMEKGEEHLKAIKTEVADTIRKESSKFEKIRAEIEQDTKRHKLRSYGVYVLYVLVLATTLINMKMIYSDVTRRPEELESICKDMATGKQVAIEPESIKKKQIGGKEYTLAVIKVIP